MEFYHKVIIIKQKNKGEVPKDKIIEPCRTHCAMVTSVVNSGNESEGSSIEKNCGGLVVKLLVGSGGWVPNKTQAPDQGLEPKWRITES